jgi:hypothetical protein
MGHILFGLPEIEHFHLHSRVARRLTGREHRVTVMTGDPVSFEFFCYQGLACEDVPPEPLPDDHLVPIQEFAAIDCRLAGWRDPNPRQMRRAVRRLERRVTGLVRLFERDRPDLVLMYEGRTGLHRLLHFVAAQYGSKVLHIGAGLLPMTLQVDSAGVDGDATYAGAAVQDYRRAPIDDEFLAAATAAWLGRALPPPLARLGVVAPPLHRRVLAAIHACGRFEWRRGVDGVRAWQRAHQIHWPVPGREFDLPRGPFVALLLQDRDDPRIRLDASGFVNADHLVRSTWQALQRVDPGAHLAVVRAEGGTSQPDPTGWPDQVHFVPAGAGALAVAMAMAVVTVNHPLGLAGILSGTPVLHTARSPYGVPGVAFRTDGSNIADDLARALTEEPLPTLRRRFLTKILKDHHIWCPPTAPDSNGVAGVVRRIESAIDCPKTKSRPLRYRAGPVWPLAVPTRRRKHKP